MTLDRDATRKNLDILHRWTFGEEGEWSKDVAREFVEQVGDALRALSAVPVEGDMEWEWGIARKNWPSSPAYFYRNREACERAIKHPPINIPNPAGPWLILRRPKQAAWQEVTP